MRRIFALLALCGLLASPVGAQSLFNYNFPGNPGSGLAVNQTDFINNVPFASQFSDFTRVGALSVSPGTTFQSTGFAAGVVPDLSQYLSFTVSGALGNNITLTQLVFDLGRDATGPQGLIGAIYLDGALIAFQPFAISLGVTTTTWNFADILLEGSHFGTNAEFRFYGYAATGGVMTFGNTSTEGVIITGVPEPATVLGGLFASALTVAWLLRMVARRRQAQPGLA